MKFINATILNRLLVCLGLLFLSAYFPIKALALSNDPQQHFTSASTSNWAISSCGLGTYTLSLNNTLPDTVVSGESAQNGIVDTASTYTGSCAVTVTYTDPSPSTGGTQNYIKVDVYTKTVGRAFAISATDGATTVTASAGSQNILTACASAPASQTNTNPGNSWETIFLNTSSLGNITQVQIVVTDTNASMTALSGFVLFDNLRGDPNVSCAATNTATQTATQTFTNTPGGNTPTFTNTPTITVTNTPTQTDTSTLVATGTNTPTQTATNTGNTATATNTPTNTPTSTITLTSILTNTATVTATLSPAPCQVEVYPNPMDFTVSSSILNCPTGKCIMFSCLPLNATVKIYTISLALVRVFPQGSVITGSNLPPGVGYIAWDGTNGNNSPVSSGLYFYVVNAPGVNTFGKFAISKSMYGP